MTNVCLFVGFSDPLSPLVVLFVMCAFVLLITGFLFLFASVFFSFLVLLWKLNMSVTVKC